jgi:hypothetical protein
MGADENMEAGRETIGFPIPIDRDQEGQQRRFNHE